VGCIQRQPERVVERILATSRSAALWIRCSVTAARCTRMESTSTSVDMPAVRTDSAPRRSASADLQRLLRRLEAFSRQNRTVISSDHAGNHLHLGSALLFSGHLPREVGRFTALRV